MKLLVRGSQLFARLRCLQLRLIPQRNVRLALPIMPLQRRQSHATILQRSWTLQLLPLGPRNVPATLLDAATAASGSTQRSCNATRLQGAGNAAASGATQRCCNASGRCNCCFQGHATLLQRSWTLQLLLPGPRKAPPTLLDVATASSRATQGSCTASRPTQGSCNAPRHHVSNYAHSCY